MRALLLWCGVCLLLFSTQVEADPCRTNFGGCDRFHGLCWGTGNDTHFCTCKAGYQPYEGLGYHYCININECADNPCGNNAECHDSEGSYECLCKCGYVLDYTGTNCLEANKIVGMCQKPRRCYNPSYGLSGVPWFSQKTILYVPFSTAHSENFLPDDSSIVLDTSEMTYTGAKCQKGYEKNICGYCEDIDECATYQDECIGIRNRCINTEGSYYCTCDEGYVLGPCRRQCYRQGSTNIPQLCRSEDLAPLLTSGITFKTYNDPVRLQNFRSCASGKQEGETTIENYDLDSDNATDVTLTWVCSTGNAAQRSILKGYAEGDAYWEEWSAWTVCKATCWGGVQTRVRMCRNGLPGVGGCPGRGLDKRNCYKGPKCPFRIRKDLETLTEAEKNDLINAMKQYKADKSVRGFHNAASAHGWPGQCGGQPCCPHGAKMNFLSWHRTILLNYEEGLARYLKDKTLGIPYWNWLRQVKSPPALLWNKTLPYIGENPFANMTVRLDLTGPMRTIQRSEVVSQGPLNFATDSWNRVSTRKLQSHIMHEFAESTESGHGGPHVSVCTDFETCTISLARLNFAGFDPIFMAHHSQVDRQWAIAQYELGENATWTIQTALEVLEEEANLGRPQMPFGNTSLNMFPKVQAVNNMWDSWFYEELTGVKYDTLENLGFPPTPVGTQQRASARSLRLAGDETLFIGHYFQSDTQNFYVNYYFDDGSPCNETTEATRLGGVLRLGTDRPFRLTIPHLTPSRNLPINSGLDFEFGVRACYTSNVTCRVACPEVTSGRIRSMPTPNLVYYIPNTPADVYKFDWSTGNRMPPSYINLDARSQYLLFYGDRAANVRQVQTPGEYLACNAANSKAVPCQTPGGNACILPAGIYYLIDSDSTNCNNGLKMIIVSRMTHHY